MGVADRKPAKRDEFNSARAFHESPRPNRRAFSAWDAAGGIEDHAMPQRFLRPGITTSRRWNSLDWQTQSFYIRLLTLVDDFGRYYADYKILRSHAFPMGDNKGNDIPLKTIENICFHVFSARLAVFYVDSDGQPFLEINRWTEKPRAQHSRYPDPAFCKQMFADEIICCASSSSSSSSSSPPVIGEGVNNGEVLKTHQLRIGGWYKRRESTPWSETERSRLKRLEPISDDDLALMETYYTGKHPADKDYRRKDLLTLLNNWNGELDRARQFTAAKNNYSKHL